VLLGSSRSGPSDLRYNGTGSEKGYSINEFYAIKHINEVTGASITSNDDLKKLLVEHTEADSKATISFEDFVIGKYGPAASSTSSRKPVFKSIIDELEEVLEWKKNVILEGVPGVGKTFCINQLKKKLGMKKRGSNRFASLTFSPSTEPEGFIGGLFPLKGPSPPVFEFHQGVLLDLAEKASNDPKKEIHLLFIDEINRGNIPKIMGQIMTVIEGSKRFKADGIIQSLVDKPDSVNYRSSMFTEGNKVRYLGLPDNLYIVGAMNTSDRSVIQIDSALRRRFAFLRIPTLLKPDSLEELHALLNNTTKFWTEKRLKTATDFLQLLAELNLKLNEEIGPDGMLGHSYLFEVKCCDENSGLQDISAETKKVEKSKMENILAYSEDNINSENEIESLLIDKEGSQFEDSDDCLWLALRDMYLYSILPQIADILNANGTSKDTTLVEKTEEGIKLINEKTSKKIEVCLRKPVGFTGEWRIE
jgi:MoxR-like ATPase